MRAIWAFLLLWIHIVRGQGDVLPTETIEEAHGDDEESPLLLPLRDGAEDSFLDPMQPDPDCDGKNCWDLPESTIEEEKQSQAVCVSEEDAQQCYEEEVVVDKHWGSDPSILRMRDTLRQSGSGASERYQNGTSSNTENHRPPIFLLPGLAATRLVAWKFKACPHNPLLSDIKVQDYVWLNINLIMQMATIDISCMRECLSLGWNQTDTDDLEIGCKLRADEGLDAISSLSPGGIGSQLLVGGTNTVYAWLIQWLAENLGYDVSNIVGLPYDWRLSPDKLEQRDGFLTLIRRRIEAAVQSNGQPGIMVAHSMGNQIFRYFLIWLRSELRKEAYTRYVKKMERRQRARQKQNAMEAEVPGSYFPGWMNGAISSFDEWFWAETEEEEQKVEQLRELAEIEGDNDWYEWIEKHIWTYVGLSAPMLGAVNPLRAVISGENMGLPVTDPGARDMEITFGSTHTVNPVSTSEGFCDNHHFDEWDEPSQGESRKHADSRLACLDDITTEIDASGDGYKDPWQNFPTLKLLLHDRVDWDTDQAMIEIKKEFCEEKERPPCANNTSVFVGPTDAQSGEVFNRFADTWKEEFDPLRVKREQLRESYWDTGIPNMLNMTWERPLIKHVVMAYGVDIPTEVGYVYRKKAKDEQKRRKDDTDDYDGLPNIQSAFWEMTGGKLWEERFDHKRGLTDLLKPKAKKTFVKKGSLNHSGDGSVPYLSLMWAHTWLLHSVRAQRHSGSTEGSSNPLDDIEVSHRPKGATEWKDGPPPESISLFGEKKVEESSDTGTAHPHGTRYKPEMVRYHSAGNSRTTGIAYTTTVIEAIGVEHKETTRNYDILAAVFTDVLRRMHDDLNIV